MACTTRLPITPELLTGARERAGMNRLAPAGMIEERACEFQEGNP